ncbi:restriction endonuclease subunit S [Vibrio sp. PNB23_22_6]
MTGRYKAYSEYKDSGIEWLKDMPSHWELIRAKHLFQRVQRPVRPQDGIVTAFRDGEVTLRSNRRTDGFTNAAKEIGYQGVRKGDLLVHAMDGFAGAIGISDSDGKCSPVCSVCIPRKSHMVDPTYFGYLVRQLAVTDYITSLAKGIRERSTEFRFAEFASLFLAAPPKEEQKKIANFLDHETAKIDALITKQEKLIELLKEKRQAVISHAVTKGLNPQAPMKDSGVEWLGEVPEHWKVANIGRISEVKRGSGYQNIDMEVGDNTSIKMLRISDMHAIKPALIVKNNEVVKFTVSAGDILVAGTGATAGISMVVPPECSGWVHSYNSIKVKVKSNVAESEFVQLFLTSDYISKLLDVSFVGSAQPFVDTNGLKKLRVLLPPKSEQKFIVNQLKEKLLRLDAVSSRAESLISLMKERKTALISAAVTGKIDVRDWEVN